MHPSIAALIAVQHQQELRATAARYRRVRGSARTPRAHKARPQGSVRGHPHPTFRTWLAAGRL